MNTAPLPSANTQTAICSAAGQETTAGAAVELRVSGSSAPEWVQLMTVGELVARDGRPSWHLKDPQRVIEQTRAQFGDQDLPFDYDHQIDYAARGVGNQAKAAGWIKALEARPDGIWGRVEWTAAAAQAVAAKEYRYLSPVFDHTKDTREVLFLRRAGLTNNPALTLTALSHQQTSEVQVDPVLKAFLEALGLKAETDQATALAHAKSLVEIRAALGIKSDADAATALAHAKALTGAKAVVDATAKKLGVTGDATDTAIAAAIDKVSTANGAPDPAKFVPIGAVKELQTTLASIQSTISADKAKVAVETAMANGQITPAMKSWAEGFATKDLDGFQDYLKAAPRLVQPSGLGGKTALATADGELSAEDTALCAQLNIKPEDFKATRLAEKEA